MIRLIQVVLLGAVVFGVVYFMEEINRGNINPQAVLQQKTQEITSMTQQMMNNVYDEATDDIDDGIDEVSSETQQMVRQIMP